MKAETCALKKMPMLAVRPCSVLITAVRINMLIQEIPQQIH
uniref:Uncharacterized protein n=1 Tax=Anguilla anguilla TaxID=7936 RepID=A0A0E9VSJ9_ANGAN